MLKTQHENNEIERALFRKPKTERKGPRVTVISNKAEKFEMIEAKFGSVLTREPKLFDSKIQSAEHRRQIVRLVQSLLFNELVLEAAEKTRLVWRYDVAQFVPHGIRRVDDFHEEGRRFNNIKVHAQVCQRLHGMLSARVRRVVVRWLGRRRPLLVRARGGIGRRGVKRPE